MASVNHATTLYCKETKEYYMTRVNKKRRNSYANKDHKLALKKYSPKLRRKALFVEVKKLFKKK